MILTCGMDSDKSGAQRVLRLSPPPSERRYCADCPSEGCWENQDVNILTPPPTSSKVKLLAVAIGHWDQGPGAHGPMGHRHGP